MKVEFESASTLRGELSPPPDKSISHRAIIISSIAEGRSVVKNFLRAGDTMSTVNAMRALGVQIEDEGAEMVVNGSGLRGLTEPSNIVDCGNSGTTMRLLSGVLAGNLFMSVLTGDESLRRRPMLRVINPLSLMGATIMARDGDRFPPIAIRGGDLNGIRFNMPVASAQVKSAILLAGLYAEGDTEVIEPFKSRDHTERMLPIFGVSVDIDGPSIRIRGGAEPWAADIEVPGDFSSAAFFVGAALITENSEVKIKDVGLNSLRTGLLQVLELMGADISVENQRNISGEPVGDIIAKSSSLKGIDVAKDLMPSMIDEFPILCVLASVAEGVTTIKGGEELRVKESDRVRAMAEGLRAMGVAVEEYPDGLSIKGEGKLRGARVNSMGDHRIAMAFSVAALAASGKTVIERSEAADISFPGFYDILRGLSA